MATPLLRDTCGRAGQGKIDDQTSIHRARKPSARGHRISAAPEGHPPGAESLRRRPERHAGTASLLRCPRAHPQAPRSWRSPTTSGDGRGGASACAAGNGALKESDAVARLSIIEACGVPGEAAQLSIKTKFDFCFGVYSVNFGQTVQAARFEGHPCDLAETPQGSHETEVGWTAGPESCLPPLSCLSAGTPKSRPARCRSSSSRPRGRRRRRTRGSSPRPSTRLSPGCGTPSAGPMVRSPMGQRWSSACASTG